MTFISVVIAAAGFLSLADVLQYETGLPVELAQSGCNPVTKKNCPMQPETVTLTTDGEILGPKGEVLLKAKEPIAIKGPDGQIMMVGKTGGSCCSATDKSCCPTREADATIVTIVQSGDLLDAKGRTIFKATDAYKIKGPGGEMIYEHPAAFVGKR